LFSCASLAGHVMNVQIYSAWQLGFRCDILSNKTPRVIFILVPW